MSTSPKTALVAGATGLIGSYVLKSLLESSSYDRVIVLTRKPLSLNHPKLEEIMVTLDTMAEGVSSLKADDWFCTLGTTIKQAGSQEAFRQVDYEYPLLLGQQAADTYAQQFLIVTAFGSSASSSIFYSRVKGQLERELRALSLPILHLFRPSLLLGDREVKRGGERVAAVLMKGLNPLLVGPLRKYRAIQAEKVAAAMVREANRSHERGVQVYEGDRILQAGVE
jgi:uncharacterized protein YbjT (DUF2867 family)